MEQNSALVSVLEHIFIDEKSRGSDLSQRLCTLFPKEKISWVSETPLKNDKGSLTAEQFSRSKKLLYVKPFEGEFFKRCPGATQKKTLACCNYHVLNLGQQCNMNCSYCYLQSYLNSPVMQMYSNINKALAELEDMASRHPDHPFRVGTGEVIDSLSLDPLSLYSRQLIAFFKKYPRWTLEFKTKSAFVEQFLDCEHSGNVVVSWSINAPFVIASEEHGTASFEERLQAARKCVDAGFKIAFHIDPMIWFEGWREGYAILINEITARFKPEEVNIISVGALRFQPEQRHMMRERFGLSSLVTQAEMFMSEGGKMRFDARVRNEMFQFVISGFKNLSPRWNIFMCMETPETWIQQFEKTPMQIPELKEVFRPLPKV